MLGDIVSDEVLGPCVISTNMQSLWGQAVQTFSVEGILSWEIFHHLTTCI